MASDGQDAPLGRFVDCQRRVGGVDCPLDEDVAGLLDEDGDELPCCRPNVEDACVIEEEDFGIEPESPGRVEELDEEEVARVVTDELDNDGVIGDRGVDEGRAAMPNEDEEDRALVEVREGRLDKGPGDRGVDSRDDDVAGLLDEDGDELPCCRPNVEDACAIEEEDFAIEPERPGRVDELDEEEVARVVTDERDNDGVIVDSGVDEGRAAVFNEDEEDRTLVEAREGRLDKGPGDRGVDSLDDDVAGLLDEEAFAERESRWLDNEDGVIDLEDGDDGGTRNFDEEVQGDKRRGGSDIGLGLLRNKRSLRSVISCSTIAWLPLASSFRPGGMVIVTTAGEVLVGVATRVGRRAACDRDVSQGSPTGGVGAPEARDSSLVNRSTPDGDATDSEDDDATGSGNNDSTGSGDDGATGSEDDDGTGSEVDDVDERIDVLRRCCRLLGRTGDNDDC